ncbi:MAG: DUF3488 and transglutaminase-like domain-containing protein [Desulfobacterales bacterium]|nr:DUF3488 and transglutaminase-like domain-containing protein [Desulfobacterales bacterium]
MKNIVLRPFSRLRSLQDPPEDRLVLPGLSATDRERQDTVPIIVALIVAIAPHVPGLPFWITLWCILMWGYTLIRLKTGWPLPRPLIRYLLTFVAIIGLLANTRLVIGADAFVGLMSLMAAIKPFEMPTHRHKMITILLTYFIIITSLFRSDSIFIVLYMLFSVFVTTLAMIRINAPDRDFSHSRNLSATMLAQSVPLVMVLFLVFPRLPESIVGVQDPSQGKSGFSESLEPGRISSMALDQTPAFRVEFQSGVPRPDQLYWRGVVFQDFDGRIWRPLAGNRFMPMGRADLSDSGTMAYTILMAPHNSHWLMALDRPVKGPSWAVVGLDHSLRARIRITKKTQYQAFSLLPESQSLSLMPHRIQENERREAHRLQQTLSRFRHLNPSTRALSLKITETAATPSGKAAAILSFFKENDFIYSLNPGRSVPPHPIDDFIFKSRKGYCEHYASAFAFMMNAAGVPARVVGGYLGGEFNPYGGYLIVRQSYAHAWTEYFDETRGWVRVDPTSAVAPERLTLNPDGSSARAMTGGASGISFITKVRFALDAVNLRWESWFTGYSYFDQQAWLNTLGFLKGNGATTATLILLTIAGLCVFAAVLAWQYRRRKPAQDPVAEAYEALRQKLVRADLVQKAGQGHVDFLKGSMEQRPDLAPEIGKIMDLYVGLRYKRQTPGSAIAEFKQRIKRFRPIPPPRTK